MRTTTRSGIMKGLLIAGVVLGFGSGFHHLAHHRHAQAERLTQVCVDAALHRAPNVTGRHDRWVAERCAAHADATSSAPAP